MSTAEHKCSLSLHDDDYLILLLGLLAAFVAIIMGGGGGGRERRISKVDKISSEGGGRRGERAG